MPSRDIRSWTAVLLPLSRLACADACLEVTGGDVAGNRQFNVKNIITELVNKNGIQHSEGRVLRPFPVTLCLCKGIYVAGRGYLSPLSDTCSR